MQVLNKYDKEELVIKMHQDGMTIRAIASAAHLSFGDIGKIIRRLDGSVNNDDNKTDLSNKSKSTQALYLFEHGKKPIDIAIELDLSASEIHEIQEEFWALDQLHDLVFMYNEIKNYLPSFMKLVRLLKQNKMLGEKNIIKLLGYASDDLPTLENRCHKLGSDALELQITKKQLGNEVAALRSSIFQLETLQKHCQMDITQKRQIISNLDQQLNQKIDALEKASLE